MAFVTKGGLAYLDRKLAQLKNWQAQGGNSVVQKALDLISEKMLAIAKEEYAGVSSANLATDIQGNRVTLTASGRGLMFIEFGTGLTGLQSGYPKENLPTGTIWFERTPKAKDGEQIGYDFTQGWEYYYDNPRTKVLGGWFLGKKFTTGEVAGMQMFNTMKRVREYIQTDLAKDIRKGD